MFRSLKKMRQPHKEEPHDETKNLTNHWRGGTYSKLLSAIKPKNSVTTIGHSTIEHPHTHKKEITEETHKRKTKSTTSEHFARKK